MSEVKSRPSGPRTRGSGRAGRGGFTSRGRGGRNQAGGSKVESSTPNLEDEGEIGELKSKFSSQLATIKEMFPDWTDEDIVFALAETDGDLEGTINRITEGNVSQWGEVKKKTKDRSQSKPKESAAPSTEGPVQSTRGGRGRGGADVARGSRGRGSDRGRAASRGGRGSRGSTAPRVNGFSTDTKGYNDTAVTDKAVGDWSAASPETDPNNLDSSWEHVTPESAQPAVEEEKPAPTNSAPKTSSQKAPQAAPSHDAPIEPPIPTIAGPTDGLQPLPPPISAEPTSEVPSTPPTSDLATSEQATDITPPKDDLTETNLEKLPDNSGPTASATAASTVASTIDHRNISGTPLGLGHQSTGRPPLGGFATTAYKATGMPGRSASFQRKILEQQEAVVMPGKHAVDKTAVQFGSMGLNGTPEDVDVDSDREDAETRAQPPQHSPVAPRASLPPAPQQQQQQQQQQELPAPPAVETLPVPRPAPGLPPVSQPLQSVQQSASESQPSIHPFSQYSERYGQPSTQPENTASSQKAYEPFGQQLQQSQPYDPFGSNSNQSTGIEPRQYGAEKYGSSAANMSSYYNSEEQRNAFQNHYGGYGQQPQPGQDSSSSQPRTSSAIGTSAPGQPPQQATVQSRFGHSSEPQNSGHSTPYGTMPSQQPANPAHSSAPGQHGGYGYGGYPYNNYYSSYMGQMHNQPYSRERPMYDDGRRFEDQYLAQSPSYSYGGGQSGYGASGPFSGGGGKSLYAQQHAGYGASPQTSHEQHSASPANAGAFGQQLPSSGREGGGAPGLSNYGGRAGSAQPQDNLHGSNQSSIPDVFGRSQSGFQGQGQSLTSGADDPLRGYGDSSKIPGGPSPALGQSGGRPGSAVNPQTGLPTQDARFSASGYSGYPGHSQYGGGPGAGGPQSGQQGGHQGYGGYSGGYGGNYYNNSNRGGWGANYGH
ncbi:uncharacterized protein KY384_000782 [Bacidia gigantensis]|uniref:uncharacterized protein n=1 Tax=Bacidia gigantensis TaxID=2732470 RepID=UPI001D052B20|nr:uncharacterized protein KY384_000782 [Bacidia gigantensis]KAG8526020.1 hypothetical protein KY384_000782 [Bacidia gigantensis]